MRLGIRHRQYLGFGAVLALLVVVGFVGWWSTAQLAAEFRALHEGNLQAAAYLAEAERGMWNLRFGLPNYLTGELDARQRVKVESEKWFKQTRDAISAYAALPITPAEKATLGEWDEAFRAYVDARPKYFALVDEGKADEAKAFRASQTNPPAAKAVASLAKLITLQQEIGGQRQVRILSVSRTSTALLTGLLVVALTVGIGLSVLTSRSITRPIAEMVATLRDIDGDLTRRLPVERRDELGDLAQWFNTFIARLHDVVAQIGQAASAVSQASQELSGTSTQLASGAQEQAASLEQTAASLEEIVGSVKQNSDGARQAVDLTTTSRDVAERGGAVVAEAVTAMAGINQASSKIAEIITTVDEIAFQTNLLALNAAVEAARAGEQGRGFAVVAAEVRSLAQRAATAAKEIKQLIQDSVARITTGSRLVDQSGATLNEIVTSVQRVAGMVAEIASASREQATGIDQVSRAMSRMDQVTQGNATQTEELSATARALADQSQRLHAMVAQFKVGTSSTGAARTEPALTERLAGVAARRPRLPGRTASPASAGDAAGRGASHLQHADAN
jgi:methyl-accepting chemotaxis protein